MTQPNNLSAIDKRIADAKQAEAGNTQTQAGQTGPDNGQQSQTQPKQPIQPGQDKPANPQAQPDSDKPTPTKQP